ncbi:hypothetical protein H4R18_000425 [Coemansia javaensis]|uniref:Uncharacterized protein n=1 Tax=Coemansia javaensis TaxID=2761396 RepID=A0A9W8HL77_9FUNG|nr:hypothetical protein H4R18_000425 [Coemansia javaensis]
MHRRQGSGSHGGQQRVRHEAGAAAGEELPTYEETLETVVRKRYRLERPDAAGPTVHAVDADTGRIAYRKAARGPAPGQAVFYAGGGEGQGCPAPAWSCVRERDGLELVFSRQVDSPPLPPPLSASSGMQFGQHAEPPAAAAAAGDGIATDSAANLYDNKPAEDSREYIHQENDDAPPAYEESDPGAEQQVRLTSAEPFPFAFDFSLPDSTAQDGGASSGRAQGGGQQWLRNQEAKNPETVAPDRPWTEFMCVERADGRLLAEVIHVSAQQDRGLGTLVVHGDLDPDKHEFLVVSAIAVAEEYPARCLAYPAQAGWA